MMKSKTIGMLNWCLGLFTTCTAPIITYTVPRENVWHGYFLTVGLVAVVHSIDMCNSDCTARNLDIMRKAGFSEVTIWGSALSTLFGFQLPGIALTLYCMDYNPDWEIPTRGYFAIDKVFWALIMVLSTDALFYVMHKFLHEHLPQIHLLHHCCIHSSQTTGLFFHPIDLAIEFSAPTLAVFLLAKYWIQDPWMFALSAAIINAWYGSLHDEWLESAHVKHHRGCATGYFVYVNYFHSDPSKESVRKYLPKKADTSGDVLKKK